MQAVQTPPRVHEYIVRTTIVRTATSGVTMRTGERVTPSEGHMGSGVWRRWTIPDGGVISVGATSYVLMVTYTAFKFPPGVTVDVSEALILGVELGI